MLLHDVVTTSAEVAATRSRLAKTAAIADLLRRVAGDPGTSTTAEARPVALVAAYVAGSLRQRRTGVGHRGLSGLPHPAETPSLTVVEVDAAFDELAALAGPGSQGRRAEALSTLFSRATVEEQRWLRGAITDGVRQGASEALVLEGVAQASEVPIGLVRRAAMLTGSAPLVAALALTGGEAEVAAVGLEVGRPVQPMLASTATDVPAALAKAHADRAPVAVDTKLDGIRVQAHKRGDDVLLVTRSLDDITSQLPEVVDVVRRLPTTDCVLDGEVLTLAADGRPRPFQETASRTATREPGAAPKVGSDGDARVAAYFFDVLHVDGRDLLDEPGTVRAEALERLLPVDNRVPRVVTDDAEVALAFTREVLAAGHEGVVVKDLTAPYAAGRRGAAWVKVKPVLTLDLVVIGVEWGSGRRTGLLSNLHLAARGPDHDGEPTYVMLGKTFKGMTDELLAWQTERFLGLETSRTAHLVRVRPEQVVEVAIDGVQRSTRYPGGVALRFARVLRYRDDKQAAEADTVEAVQALLSSRDEQGSAGPGSRGPA